ncbi:hypothetical protein RJ640_019118 [Escallonia rubra]|uniref:Aluminum-activated malate transporter 10 n=1 Tax=Escallonia rubra TaxID=112253 RepID=A0AA88UE54_9ASTE|nr:hypothetical protein RJ640_019118 [Escallonia rubra]
MTNSKEAAGNVEWMIRVGSGSPEVLIPEPKPARRDGLKGLIVNFVSRVYIFLEKAWDIGVEDPRKVMHCLKVGIALSVVSLFYYTRPLYEGVGGKAMWAVMTVVVVFEYTVGATLCKCLNRTCATFLAGALAIGIHWVASKSGEKIEPIILGTFVFLLASATTFSRFLPVVKARFDYGATIFILTFSLVSVSGYRVEKLLDLAQQRLSTIMVGTCLCILIGMLIFPIWAGEELHLLITRNLDKLAKSLDCCVAEYFSNSEDTISSNEESNKNLQAYKCVLNSKAAEETMAGFARWEPAHGRFNFQHPWKQYLKIGGRIRNCAYCIETLNSCLDSENQVPEVIKKHLRETCLRVCSKSTNVIRELATIVTSMKKSPKIGVLVEDMNDGVQELQNNLKSIDFLIQPPLSEAKVPEDSKSEASLTTATTMPLVEVIPLVSFASLLTETVARIDGLVDAVEELEDLAKFKPAADAKPKPNQPNNKMILPDDQQENVQTMATLQRV